MFPSSDSVYNLTIAGVSIAFLFFSARYAAKRKIFSRHSAPYPPGPKGYPFINNIFDIPKINPWMAYAEMAKQIGSEMVFVRAFSQPILVLCSKKTINDLLENRSSVYSGRPHSVMLNELLGTGGFPMMSYTPRWRKQRRTFHQHYSQTAILEYRPLIKRHVQTYLLQLLASPNDFEHHAHHLFGGTIMHIGYGFEPLLHNDPYIAEALEAVRAFKVAGIRGTFLVDDIPLLKYVPAWVPGAGFQRWAAYYRVRDYNAKAKPFKFVLDQVKKNEAPPCVMTKLIEDLPSEDDPTYKSESEDAKNVVGVSYLAGTDTTTATAITFLLVMAMYPEYQRKAREELDRVVGPGILPDFTHRDELVYIKAVMTELMRWYQTIPLALPHMMTEDDYYNGSFIPKGTIVLGNAWAVLHDPDVFEDPMEFRPERYITKDRKFNTDLLNPNDYAFGFGRRICPGRHLSMDMFYLMAVSTLAMFEILPPKDEAGVPIELKASFDSGLLVNPRHFDCIIRPRSSATESTLRNLAE